MSAARAWEIAETLAQYERSSPTTPADTWPERAGELLRDGRSRDEVVAAIGPAHLPRRGAR